MKKIKFKEIAHESHSEFVITDPETGEQFVFSELESPWAYKEMMNRVNLYKSLGYTEAVEE